MTPRRCPEEPGEKPRPPSESSSSSSSSRALELVSAAPSPSPSPPGGALGDLAEARRRLLEAESRRALVSELERRVVHLRGVFVEAELRLAGRAESLSRLAGGVAQAELRLAPDAALAALLRPRRCPPPPGPKKALLRRLRGASSCLPCGWDSPQSPAFARRTRREPREGAPAAKHSAGSSSPRRAPKEPQQEQQEEEGPPGAREAARVC